MIVKKAKGNDGKERATGISEALRQLWDDPYASKEKKAITTLGLSAIKLAQNNPVQLLAADSYLFNQVASFATIETRCLNDTGVIGMYEDSEWNSCIISNIRHLREPYDITIDSNQGLILEPILTTIRKSGRQMYLPMRTVIMSIADVIAHSQSGKIFMVVTHSDSSLVGEAFVKNIEWSHHTTTSLRRPIVAIGEWTPTTPINANHRVKSKKRCCSCVALSDKPSAHIWITDTRLAHFTKFQKPVLLN
jgi:hypothetical protein